MFGLVTDQPTLISVTQTNVSSMTINWTKPDLGGEARYINQYHIELRSSDAESNRTATVNDDSQNIKFVVTGLESNTKYNLTVAASSNGMLIGEKSDQKVATTSKKIEL